MSNPVIDQMIAKFNENKDPRRLNILLESYGKKLNKATRDALTLLIEDGDKDAIYQYLGQGLSKEDKDKKELADEFVLTLGPMNQDDFIVQVKRNYGNPEDEKSLGNRVLEGATSSFQIRSYYKPDVMLRKFAALAKKEMCELDFHPTNISSKGQEPLWDVCILGTRTIQRNHEIRVN